MPRRLSFIAVEGQHDAAFVGRLLREASFKLITWKEPNPREPLAQFLEPALGRLVPSQFPNDNNLLARVPVPFFWQKDDHVVSLRPAEGESKLISSVCAAERAIRPDSFAAIGIILDADNKGGSQDRLARLKSVLIQEAKTMEQPVGFALPNKLGDFTTTGTTQCGVFVMPDNLSAGTVEDLLLDCASTNYPNLKLEADKYLQAIDRSVLKGRDLNEIEAPAGKKKALVGIIGSVLKPGKAIQVSIADNLWVDAMSKELPRVVSLRHFLCDLLNEPTI
ncbi:MAG: DUF3226 domain-containing protein [Opitutaceae bacterium]|jgi:hypothetical protein